MFTPKTDSTTKLLGIGYFLLLILHGSAYNIDVYSSILDQFYDCAQRTHNQTLEMHLTSMHSLLFKPQLSYLASSVYIICESYNIDVCTKN